MIYLLLIFFLGILIISYFLCERDLLSPMVIVASTFLFSVFLDALYTDIWQLPMHFNTTLIIMSEVLFFLLGAFLIQRIFYGKVALKENENNTILSHDLNLKYFFLINVIMFIFLYLNYKEFCTLSQSFTNSSNLGDMIHALIQKISSGEAQMSRWYSYRYIFMKSYTYIYIYIFAWNSINFNFKLKNFIFLIPLAIFIPAIIFTAGRQEFVYLSIYSLIVSAFIYQKKYNFDYKKSIQLVGFIIIFLSTFLGLFFLSGYLSGKITITMSPLRVLAHYAGINISAFDYFVNTEYNDTLYIGRMTLAGIYVKLLNWGIPVFNTHMPYVQFYGIDTNVYTAFRKYIQDYGYVGCSIIMFLLGVLYTFAYNYLKYCKFNHFGLLIYSLQVYPIFLLCREERFFTGIISTTFVYTIFCIYFFYKMIIERKGGIDVKSGIFHIFEQIKRKWYIILFSAIVCAGLSYGDKAFFHPVTPVTGNITFTKVARLEVPQEIYVQNGIGHDVTITSAVNMWSNMERFLEKTESKYNYEKFNKNWNMLKKTEKFSWLNKHLRCQYLGNNVYEFIFQFTSADVKDIAYLQNYGDEYLTEYLQHAEQVAFLMYTEPKFIILDTYSVMDEYNLGDTSFILQKYTIIGFILGIVLGVAIVSIFTLKFFNKNSK